MPVCRISDLVAPVVHKRSLVVTESSWSEPGVKDARSAVECGDTEARQLDKEHNWTDGLYTLFMPCVGPGL